MKCQSALCSTGAEAVITVTGNTEGPNGVKAPITLHICATCAGPILQGTKKVSSMGVKHEPNRVDLADQGCSLRILKVDPITRRASILLELLRKEPMTEAEAQKYIDANYPNKGAVRAAAEILSLLRED